MKKLILSFIVICLAMSAYSQHPQSLNEVMEKLKTGNEIIKGLCSFSFAPYDSLVKIYNDSTMQAKKDARVEFMNDSCLVVGKLLSAGDYSAYYKINENKSYPIRRNCWVFIPKEVYGKMSSILSVEKNNSKTEGQGDIKANEQNGKHANEQSDAYAKMKYRMRLCQFLGLDTASNKDTIVFLQIKPNDLFRPAYNFNINEDVRNQDKRSCLNMSILSDKKEMEICRWFVNELFTNKLPWTRMGYTYDWGYNNKENVGATEFVTLCDAQVKCLGFMEVENFFGKKYNLDIKKKKDKSEQLPGDKKE